MRDLTRGSIAGHIAMMALPIVIGMLVQTLYYLVDLYFVSQLGPVALAGVVTAGNAMFLVIALTQTLHVGTMATVSHAVGAKDQEGANRIFNQAVLLASILGVVTVVGGYLGMANLYVSAIGADAETIAAGNDYLRWVLPAMAFQFGGAAMGAALQGTGIVKPTMIVQMLTVFVNTLLTPVLVAGWGPGPALGVAGAGLATTLASALGFALMAYYFFKFEHYVRFDAKQLPPDFPTLKKMLGIGLPAGGEFALLFVYIAIIFQVVGRFGATAQAGFGVGSRVMQAVFLPAMAISFALPAVIGQNYGARNGARVREAFRTAAWMCAGFMLLLTFFCQWRPDLLVAPFSKDADVLQIATGFLTLISWNFVAYGLNSTCGTAFQGIGNTVPSLFSTATRLVTFIVPVYWLATKPWFKIEHVWYMSVITVAFQAVLSYSLLRWQFNKRLNFPDPPVEVEPQPEPAPA